MRRPRHGSRCRRAVAAVLVVVLVGTGTTSIAGAEAPGAYAPPVDAPLTDPFREPPDPYAPGNRGVDYRTAPGGEVRAAGPGEVTFAGQVGGGLHVVVLHPDGLRTSYSYLASLGVHRGEVVARGQAVGTSGGSLHFGVRAGERYVDPALLLAGGPSEVHLIPLEDRRVAPVADERRGLRRLLAAGGPAAAAAVGWLVDRSAGAAVAHARRRVELPLLLARTVAASRRGLAALSADQASCTPSGAPPPRPPAGRRIAVLVAGYGSTGGDADVLDVDTSALGYADADVAQLSYAGGRVEGVGALAGVPTSRYGPQDSMGDLHLAGRRLRQLLDDVAAAHPGVPVDVIAHSQGGVVARAALADPGAGPTVEHLVTLGTPHHGATLASLARELDLTDGDSVVAEGITVASGGGADPGSTAVAQLAAGSAFLAHLGRHPPRPGVEVTSIAASGDLVVPALSSVLGEATNVLVPVGGLTGHGRLPGSPEAARELALALGGAGPTCTASAALAARVVRAAAIAALEQASGSAAGPTVRLVDDLAGAASGVLAAATG